MVRLFLTSLTLISFRIKFLGISIARTVQVTAKIPKIEFRLAVGVKEDLIVEVHVAELRKPKVNLEVKFDKKLWVFGSVEKIIMDVIERVKPPAMELVITTVNNKLREIIPKALDKLQSK